MNLTNGKKIIYWMVGIKKNRTEDLHRCILKQQLVMVVVIDDKQKDNKPK